MTGTWINAAMELPKTEDPVLAVKELRNGTRDICIARCLQGYKYMDVKTKEYWTGTYWVCGGNNNIIYWMPLPKIPQKGELT